MRKIVLAVIWGLVACGHKTALQAPGAAAPIKYPQEKLSAGTLVFSDSTPVFNSLLHAQFTPGTVATYNFNMGAMVEFTLLSSSHWYDCKPIRCTDRQMHYQIADGSGQVVVPNVAIGQAYTLQPNSPYTLLINDSLLTGVVTNFQLDFAVARTPQQAAVLALSCQDSSGHALLFTLSGVFNSDGTSYFTGGKLCGHDRSPALPLQVFFRPASAGPHDPNYVSRAGAEGTYQATLTDDPSRTFYHFVCAKYASPPDFRLIETYDDLKFTNCHYVLR